MWLAVMLDDVMLDVVMLADVAIAIKKCFLFLCICLHLSMRINGYQICLLDHFLMKISVLKFRGLRDSLKCSVKCEWFKISPHADIH